MVLISSTVNYGWWAHGDNTDEPITMVKYGMKTMDAIVAATKTGAECIGIQDKVGTIEKGKIADIIGVDGNPLAGHRQP
ncbi:MAG: N-ethylammeline chlorohydrolase [Candidatus Bathyarchaeota archaeon BA1]|nr:MAG: N-ethylammeline chlorohydrolase [Candidatus Bathyarchaeota archaeon BA1]